MQVALDANAADVVRGGTVQVEVTVSRSGGDTTVIDLVAEGLPTGVTATFVPATLTGSATASVLTIEAAASVSEDAYDLLIRAGDGSLAATAELTLTITSLDISGQVMTFANYPYAGVEVRSQGMTTVTDQTGAFSLSGLSSPYDVAVLSTADEWLHVFEGVSTDVPVLTVLQTPATLGTVRSTTISGALSGGQIPVAADQTVLVCVSNAVPMAMYCDALTVGESAYSIPLQWLGDASIAATIHALQFQTDAGGYPVSYQGYSSLSLTLTDGVPVSADRNLGATLEMVEVQVDIESEDPVTATFGAVQLDPNLALTVMAAINTNVSHTAIMPVIPDATYTFAAGVSPNQFGWQADVTGAATTVNVPREAILVTPADLATGIEESANFRVSSVSGAQNTFGWMQTGGGLQVAVTTMNDSARIPSLPDYGLTLPRSTTFEWNVLSADAAEVGTATHGLTAQFQFSLLHSARTSLGLEDRGWVSATARRTFTTAP